MAFLCKKCGAIILEGERDEFRGCEHWPVVQLMINYRRTHDNRFWETVTQTRARQREVDEFYIKRSLMHSTKYQKHVSVSNNVLIEHKGGNDGYKHPTMGDVMSDFKKALK